MATDGKVRDGPRAELRQQFLLTSVLQELTQFTLRIQLPALKKKQTCALKPLNIWFHMLSVYAIKYSCLYKQELKGEKKTQKKQVFIYSVTFETSANVIKTVWVSFYHI